MQRVQKRFARDMNRAAVIDRLECGRMRGKTPIHPPARRLGCCCYSKLKRRFVCRNNAEKYASKCNFLSSVYALSSKRGLWEPNSVAVQLLQSS